MNNTQNQDIYVTWPNLFSVPYPLQLDVADITTMIKGTPTNLKHEVFTLKYQQYRIISYVYNKRTIKSVVWTVSWCFDFEKNNHEFIMFLTKKYLNVYMYYHHMREIRISRIRAHTLLHFVIFILCFFRSCRKGLHLLWSNIWPHF